MVSRNSDIHEDRLVRVLFLSNCTVRITGDIKFFFQSFLHAADSEIV